MPRQLWRRERLVAYADLRGKGRKHLKIRYITVTRPKEANGEKPGYGATPVEFDPPRRAPQRKDRPLCTEPGYTGDTYCKRLRLAGSARENSFLLWGMITRPVTAPTCTPKARLHHPHLQPLRRQLRRRLCRSRLGHDWDGGSVTPPLRSETRARPSCCNHCRAETEGRSPYGSHLGRGVW